MTMRFLLAGTVVFFAPLLGAQQPIGRTSATEVQVSGAVNISHGETVLGNGSEITAGTEAVKITLQRGGSLQLCSTTSVHLAKDRSVDDPASSALMMALDRGAIEANYVVGKYSDVLLTPDLRILISGPGQANLSIRVNTQGDTCVDNHGADAPYVTVSSQLEGGAYRVMPDQRVTFEHGSLSEVVDHEPEPCGCPAMPVTSVASTGNTGASPAAPGRPVGGPSSTPADTAFPIAESEGLAPPPAPHSAPVVPVGETHAQVTVPLTYNGENPAATPATPPTPPSASPVVAAPKPTPPPEVASAPPPPNQSSDRGGVFHRIGHFFSRIFG
ncbi:MAG TPA: hypothetical protein VFE27_14500 [Acidobacteriaceae bacterium]|nr:hypothetical protein [Acidobacteriaceae bacterium]